MGSQIQGKIGPKNKTKRPNTVTAALRARSRLRERGDSVDGDGSEVGTHRQPYLWHPWLYHYGRNWSVPGDGEYTLRVRVEAPEFPRHDKQNGRRFAEPVEVEFGGVKIQTGQK